MLLIYAILQHVPQPVAIRNVLAYLNAQLKNSQRSLTWRVSDVLTPVGVCDGCAGPASVLTLSHVQHPIQLFFADWNRKAHPLTYRLVSSGSWWLSSRSSWDTWVHIKAVNLPRTLGQQTFHSCKLYLHPKLVANPHPGVRSCARMPSFHPSSSKKLKSQSSSIVQGSILTTTTTEQTLNVITHKSFITQKREIWNSYVIYFVI
jgi:hypothetical protein